MRPRGAGSVDPNRPEARRPCSAHVVVGIVADVRNAAWLDTRALYYRGEHGGIRFRRADGRGGDVVLEMMGKTDDLEIRVAVGESNQSKLSCEYFETALHVRIELHLVTGGEEHLKQLLRAAAIAACLIEKSAKNLSADEREICRPLGKLLLDPRAQRAEPLGIVVFRRARTLHAQPSRYGGLRCRERRIHVPERVVEIESEHLHGAPARKCQPAHLLATEESYAKLPGSKAKGRTVKYLHTMVRVSDLDESLEFYCAKLGMREIRRIDNEQGRFSLVFIAFPGDESCPLELTYNWDKSEYTGGRNFGHVAYQVDNIYEVCDRLQRQGVTINRPPRDGFMAFIKSPDGISIELLQSGKRLQPQEPWASMENTGTW